MANTTTTNNLVEKYSKYVGTYADTVYKEVEEMAEADEEAKRTLIPIIVTFMV